MNLASYTRALEQAEERAATLGVASIIKYWEPLNSFADLRLDQDWMTVMDHCRIAASVDHEGNITESKWIQEQIQKIGEVV